MSDIVPREQLTKQAMKGVGGVVGGIALITVGAMTGSIVGGIIVGGLAALIGLVMTKDRADRKAGLVAVAAGGLTLAGLLIPPIRHLAQTLLTISGVGLIGLGAWSLIRFFRNLKARS